MFSACRAKYIMDCSAPVQHCTLWTVQRLYSNVHYELFSACTALYIMNCSTPVQQCTLWTIQRLYSTVHYELFSACTALYIINCSAPVQHCTLWTVQRLYSNVHYELFSACTAMYIINCSALVQQCTLWTVQRLCSNVHYKLFSACTTLYNPVLFDRQAVTSATNLPQSSRLYPEKKSRTFLRNIFIYQTTRCHNSEDRNMQSSSSYVSPVRPSSNYRFWPSYFKIENILCDWP
jgi:hypothetical protein